MFTIDELQKQTGLQINFIRRCVKTCESVLSPHVKRGDYNSLLFDDNALIIFDQIKQLKEQGLSLIEIDKQIKSLRNIPETMSNSGEGEVPKRSLQDEVIELHRQISRDKENQLKDREEHAREKLDYERRLAELKREKLVLENSLKLLPEGKPPEVIKTEWEKSQARKLEISGLLNRLEELEGKSFKGKERRQLIRRLRELQS